MTDPGTRDLQAAPNKSRDPSCPRRWNVLDGERVAGERGCLIGGCALQSGGGRREAGLDHQRDAPGSSEAPHFSTPSLALRLGSWLLSRPSLSSEAVPDGVSCPPDFLGLSLGGEALPAPKGWLHSSSAGGGGVCGMRAPSPRSEAGRRGTIEYISPEAFSALPLYEQWRQLS